jgi:hypothetical protein
MRTANSETPPDIRSATTNPVLLRRAPIPLALRFRR